MSEAEEQTKCRECGKRLIPPQTLIYKSAPCSTCARETYSYDADPKTSGLHISAGDTVKVNEQVLNQLMKLVGGARFTRAGLNLFARHLFVQPLQLIRNPQVELPGVLQASSEAADAVMQGSPLLAGLDLEDESDAAAAIERLQDKQDRPEFWAMVMGAMAAAVKDAVAKGDAAAAAAAGISLSGAHAMLRFKVDLEEAVWRGHSVESLRTALTGWSNNRHNDDEEFWQKTFAAQSFVLAQALSAPVVVLEDKAYVGGKSFSNSGGQVADFLLKNDVTTGVAIVELKVPTTRLLGPTQYRNGTFAPSSELVGAVAQVSSYAAKLVEEYPLLRLNSETELEPSGCERIVIIGTAAQELTDRARRRSFELYRSELRHVRVVTYDELYKRVETLLRLFGG